MATKIQITKKSKMLSEEQFFSLLNDMIEETESGVRTKKNGQRISSGSIRMYRCLERSLHEYAAQSSFRIKIYIDQNLTFNEKMVAKKYYAKFYRAYTNFLYQKKDFYDNYVGSLMKLLRAFFNYLDGDKHIPVGSYHRSFYTPKEEIPIVALSVEQLQYIIFNEEFNKKIRLKKLEKVRDTFVVGCTLALRVSDLLSLTFSNLVIIQDAHYIRVKSQKTATVTNVKLPDYAAEIIKKYKQKNGLLLPTMTPEWFNKKIKMMAKLLPDDFEMVKTREKRGKQMIVYADAKRKKHYKLSDHISTHTMRKTAISTMLSLGMPEHVVRKISGHAANSREFFRYVKMAQNVIDKEADKVFDQIRNYEKTEVTQQLSF
jgi:integrase